MPLPAHDKAIVIGINDFDDVAHFPALKYAESDAEGFAALLLEENRWDTDDVVIKLGRGVTADEIKRALWQTFRGPQVTAESFLVFYYAGHGFLDDRHKRGYIAFTETVESIPDSGVSMDDILKNFVLDSPAGRILVILDCCYSGAIFQGMQSRGAHAIEDQSLYLVGGENVQELLHPASASLRSRGRWVLTSCRADQRALELAVDKHGVFTDKLMEGWRGGRDGGAISTAYPNTVTINSLRDYLTREMRQYVQKPIVHGPVQTEEFIVNNHPSFRSETQTSATPIAAHKVPSPHGELARLGFTTWSSPNGNFILPPFELIQAGKFDMGTDKDMLLLFEHSDIYANEYSVATGNQHHKVDIAAFEIARFPVTVAEYAYYLEAGANAEIPPRWEDQRALQLHPVINVSWHDATAYCQWLSSITGDQYRLPSESEWEKAARWDPHAQQSRVYPWKGAWDGNYCNVSSGSLLPIGNHPQGVSALGVHELIGNVWEWTRSLLLPYPFNHETADQSGSGARVVRGTSYEDGSYERSRAAFRMALLPESHYEDVGFRLVRVPRR